MKKKYFFLFIMLALFFSNKIKAQEEVKQYLNTISNSLPDVYVKSNANLFFTIQVGAFKNKNIDLQEVKNITITKEKDNLFKYRLGEFTTYKEATEFKNIISNICKDAFIVPLKKGERIHIKEALKESSDAL